MVRSRNSAPSAKGIIALVAIVLGVILGLSVFLSFLGGWRSVPVDKIGLHYTGGPLQSAPALSPEQLAYLQIQATQTCAASPNCTLVITDGGAGVNINTAGKK